MIKSLLVGYDGSHGGRIALQHAVDVARRCEGRVCLMTTSRASQTESAVLGDGEPDLVALASARFDAEETSPLAPDADELLTEAHDCCRELTVRCFTRPAYGDLAYALTRASRLYDLVFVGRDVAAGAPRFAAPVRTARRVAAGANCPVVVVPREYEPVRSALVLCPMTEAGARALRTAAELAAVLQVKLEAVIVAESADLAGRWTHEVARYLVDHGHAARVSTHRPPLGQHLVNLMAERTSPIVVVPKGSPLSSFLQRDPLSDALQALTAVIAVQP